jgi:hypothetical protein
MEYYIIALLIGASVPAMIYLFEEWKNRYNKHLEVLKYIDDDRKRRGLPTYAEAMINED